MRKTTELLLPLLLLGGHIAIAADNKGGKLQIVKSSAWYASSLICEGDSYSSRPVVHSISPKAGKAFIIVSTEVSVDWTGFTNATQYALKTSEIMLKSGDAACKLIGIYKKGARYSEFLSSNLWIQRGSKYSNFVDLVFTAPEARQPLRLKIGEAESAVTVQSDSGEPAKLPGVFKITGATLVDEMPSAAVPTRAKAECEATLKPVDGKFLKLTVELTADGPHDENNEGLHHNNSFPLHNQNIGILLPDTEYIPAVAIVMDGKAYIGGGTEARAGQHSAVSVTFLFPVPGTISVLSLLYDKQVVVKDFNLDLGKHP